MIHGSGFWYGSWLWCTPSSHFSDGICVKCKVRAQQATLIVFHYYNEFFRCSQCSQCTVLYALCLCFAVSFKSNQLIFFHCVKNGWIHSWIDCNTTRYSTFPSLSWQAVAMSFQKREKKHHFQFSYCFRWASVLCMPQCVLFVPSEPETR